MERVKSVCYNRIFTSLDLKLLKPNNLKLKTPSQGSGSCKVNDTHSLVLAQGLSSKQRK